MTELFRDPDYMAASAFMDAEDCSFCDGVSAGRDKDNKHACKKCLAANIFKEELGKILGCVEEALSRILLSEDRTSKHPPYTWMDEPLDQHLLKAGRHINSHMQIVHGYQKPDEENHLDNAITRLAMAVALSAGVKR